MICVLVNFDYTKALNSNSQPSSPFKGYRRKTCVKGRQKENFLFRLSSLVTWKGKLALMQPKLFPKPCELILMQELWLMFSPRRCLFCTKDLLLPFLRAKTCTFLQTKTTKRVILNWINFAFPSAILWPISSGKKSILLCSLIILLFKGTVH